MAAGTDPADLSPSSGGSDLEEGEFVAGPDDDIRHEGDGLPETKRRRLEDIVVVDGGAVPSPTPSRDRDSDGTISDVDADAGAASLAPQEPLFPCPVCPREFTSQKALSGHMSSHDPHGRRQGNKERPPVTPAVSGGWAVTGKRGSLGGRSDSSESEGVVDSMATVVSDTEPVIDPMPIAFARRSSSAEPNPPNDDSMAILVAPSGDPTSQAVVHPPCSPQFLQGRQPAAPQFLVAQAQPAVAQGQQLAEEAARQFVVHQAAAPQAVAHHVQRTSPPPPARDEQRWWLCKEQWCDQRYTTPQALGGHMVGHKFRQNNEASAAGLHLGVGDPKPAKLHSCKLCPGVFTSGKQLGGHMRKHPGGNVTPKKPGARPKVSARELGSALALSLPMPPATMEVTPAQPAVAPSSPVVLRIFGVNIVVTPPAAAAQGTSSAVTETDQSSPASTNIEQ